MISWSTRGLATGIATLVMIASTATAADADAFRHRDATSDVLVRKTDNSTGAETYYAGPRRAAPDIQQLTVIHQGRVLSIATTLRALNESKSNWLVRIVTSQGDVLPLQRSIGPDIGSTPYIHLSRNDERFECTGVHVSRTSSGIIAKVPTRCLDNPWKVRVGVQAVSLDERHPLELLAQDDALRRGTVDYGRPSLGPWIAR